MPLFEYECRDCEKSFEAFVTTDRPATCPTCTGTNLRKLLSRLGMVGVAAGPSEGCATSDRTGERLSYPRLFVYRPSP